MKKNNNFINSLLNKSFLNIGKITRTHGLTGEVFVHLAFIDTKLPVIITNQKVQIRNNENGPFCLDTKIQKASLHKKGMIIKLEGVDDYQLAQSLKTNYLFVPKKFFVSNKGEDIYLCEVLGFAVEDKQRGDLGKIFLFLDNTQQDLLRIKNTKGREIEIPFIKQFIINIDFKLQKIIVDLPLNWPNLEDKEQK